LVGGVAAQKGSVTIPSHPTTLKEALTQLARQTGYSPVVNYDNIDGDRRVDLASDVTDVAELLRQITEGTGFTWKMDGRWILIVPEPPIEEETPAAQPEPEPEPEPEPVFSPGRVDTVGVASTARGPSNVSNTHREEIAVVATAPRPAERAAFFAVKTNLLIDAVGAANLELEVPLGRSWSVTGELILPWSWMRGGVVEVRRWLGDRTRRPQLAGWFAGAYAGIGNYDLSLDGRRRKGDYYHFGLSGGYAHTINRRGNLRMEYSLGAGYLKMDDKYWFGPTRGKVSFVLMLEH
jgi:hypothetical protein